MTTPWGAVVAMWSLGGDALQQVDVELGVGRRSRESYRQQAGGVGTLASPGGGGREVKVPAGVWRGSAGPQWGDGDGRAADLIAGGGIRVSVRVCGRLLLAGYPINIIGDDLGHTNLVVSDRCLRRCRPQVVIDTLRARRWDGA